MFCDLVAFIAAWILDFFSLLFNSVKCMEIIFFIQVFQLNFFVDNPCDAFLSIQHPAQVADSYMLKMVFHVLVTSHIMMGVG